LKVEKAKEIGFCFGVRRAIDMLAQAAQRYGSLETLGPVVHNHQVVASLARKGIGTIHSLDQAKGKVVAIPSHGASPQLIEAIQQRGLVLVDTTCPIVRSAQVAARKLARAGFCVAVFGEADHSEVKGILAHCQGRAVLNAGELAQLEPFPRRLGILPQTTQNPTHFARFVEEAVRSYLPRLLELRVVNTICDATRKRQAAALELAQRADLMIVVGGRHSSNTRRLAESCAAAGVPSQLIETAAEIQASWLEGKHRVGVTAGTSTPDEAIAEVVARLQELARGAEQAD